MAETVKKSRIVSEDSSNNDDSSNGFASASLLDDFEQAFNDRLKSMSQDNLVDINTDFIQTEQSDYYEVPRTNGTADQNGYEHVDGANTNTNHEYVDMTLNSSASEYEPIALTLTDLSETKPAETDVKSVKDRMLLSTDAQPCVLLFTQTVTSPMLTPSEENIDFLKGFQEEKAPEENVYENAEFLKEKREDNVIYENLVKDTDEAIYENLKDLKENNDKDEVIYQNVQELRETEDDLSRETEDDQLRETEDDRSRETEDDRSIETEDDRLKSVDIIKQINKFEADDSTQVTESYVETTVIESNNAVCDKGLKKKKSKKSRKEEKENISVNETNINNDDFYYNVNVKSLCRSFRDLTKLEDENKRNIDNFSDRTRTKSLSDVMSATFNNKSIENVFSGVSVRTLKSSFNKFDALQKKNVLHVRSSDSSKAQEKFNGASVDASNCKACDKAVFQMEQIKAERAVWHKNCFRCKECNKQLNVDTYQSHEGTLFCKPHFKALFAPKAVEDDAPPRPRKPELIIRENQPLELPPDVVRASDKPDLGLEELQSLNVKERFQVFEHHQSSTENAEMERVNVKRSPSILSKLAKFQAKGMDIGVSEDSLNGIPIEESSSEEEEDGEEEEGVNGEDADLIRAKRVQKEKPFHFTGMSDVKSKWEHQSEQNATRDERREERKQEIQSIRSRLFMGKQGKMKEAYQQAIMESESCKNLKNKEAIEACDTKSLKERFEKGELINENPNRERENEDTEVFESEISKKSRSLFLELDANASKPPQMTPLPTPKMDVKKAREAYLARTASEDVVKSSIDQVDEIEVKTADIQERFKFFETYKEPSKEKRAFRITPPREGQVKAATPDREVYRDPDVVRSEEFVEDSVIAKETHTATKMLNKFRQMEENLSKEPQPAGPKPLKRFTPPPEPARPESSSEADSGSEEESDDEQDETDNRKALDEDLLEAQKAARAKQLRAKFERWEANEIKREQNNSAVNIAEEVGEEQSQIESTKTLRARFESMRESTTETRTPRVKVNRFVEIPSLTETCWSCNSRVYPLEKVSVHNQIYHKKCFKCMECNCVLRMDSYSYNQGLLYCMPHFKRLFISKGNYDTGFGLGQHKEKWNATLA